MTLFVLYSFTYCRTPLKGLLLRIITVLKNRYNAVYYLKRITKNAFSRRIVTLYKGVGLITLFSRYYALKRGIVMLFDFFSLKRISIQIDFRNYRQE